MDSFSETRLCETERVLEMFRGIALEMGVDKGVWATKRREISNQYPKHLDFELLHTILKSIVASIFLKDLILEPSQEPVPDA